MSASDGRGSKPQRYLFELIKQIYPEYTIIYEQYIPELNQRFDIFVKELGIAIEYDGRQHDDFVEHFHKDMNGFIGGLQMDAKKENFSKENGIKVVRFKGDVLGMSVGELCRAIDDVEYPEEMYSMDCLNKKNKRLERAKKVRQKQYLVAKESFSNQNN
jgi:hypothetical protein